MAAVTLFAVWLGLGTALDAQIELEVSSIEDDDGVVGDVRTYAGGRRRSVTTAGRTRSVQIKFDVLQNRAQLATLRSWAGKRVLFRDPFGRRMWCVFFRAPASDRVLSDMPEVTLDLTEVSFSEAV